MKQEQNRKRLLADIIGLALTAAHTASGNYAGAALHASKYVKAILSAICAFLFLLFMIILVAVFGVVMIFEGNSTINSGGGTFLYPIQGMNTYISSPFGDRINPVTHKASHHDGIDIAGANINMRPIHAAADGTVEKLVTGDKWYGNYVLLDHGNGLKTFYGHCSGFAKINDGESVSSGEIIAYVGNTGNSTGPHLHFGVIVNGKYVDPTQYEYNGMKCSNYDEYHKPK